MSRNPIEFQKTAVQDDFGFALLWLRTAGSTFRLGNDSLYTLAQASGYLTRCKVPES